MTECIIPEKTLDLISIGRCSVDLYGQQIGSRLEDIGSFAKSAGGCPTNIAIGTARLGLKSALVTRVGAEQMGTFIREQLVREGVAIEGVHVDKALPGTG
jgi:5-dehydro-2-deoxygluconokinase